MTFTTGAELPLEGSMSHTLGAQTTFCAALTISSSAVNTPLGFADRAGAGWHHCFTYTTSPAYCGLPAGQEISTQALPFSTSVIRPSPSGLPLRATL